MAPKAKPKGAQWSEDRRDAAIALYPKFISSAKAPHEAADEAVRAAEALADRLAVKA
jgi:hypothetical protein